MGDRVQNGRPSNCDALVSFFDPHGSGPCWRVGKYLGSMIYADFGERVKRNIRGRGEEDVGEVAVGIRGCYWLLHVGHSLFTTSDEDLSDFDDRIKPLLMGERLLEVSYWSAELLSISLSGQLQLFLDLTNRNAVEGSIAEFQHKDGRILCVAPNGDLNIDSRLG